MTSWPKKPLTSLFIFLLTLSSSFTLLLSNPPSSHAQTSTLTTVLCKALGFVARSPVRIPFADFMAEDRPWYNQSVCQFYTKVFDSNHPDEIFGERYTYAQVDWIFNSLGAFLIHSLGTVVGDYASNGVLMIQIICPNCPVPPPDLFTQTLSPSQLAEAKPSLQNSGAMGTTFSLIDTYRPSFFHGTIPSLLSKFSLATSAHAQTGGYGFNALSTANATGQSLQALWSAFRDMSYFLMVLLLVVSGFMIMFRVRMGQTAVTLQLMIPKIITTLIGITFSFAISGFVIDLVYLTLGFVLYLLQTTSGGFVTSASTLLQDFSAVSGFWRVWVYFSSTMTIISIVLGFIIPMGFVILPILLLILLFKTWWAMLKVYAHLIIHIVTGPFQILLGLLPGQNMGFGQWLRNVVGYAAVFVVVPLVITFIAIIWNTGLAGATADWDANPLPPWTKPPVNGLNIETLPNLPLFNTGGSMGGAVLQFGIGLIMLSLLPSIMDKVPAAFKAANFGKGDITGDLIAAGVLAGQARSTATGAARGAGLPTTIPGMVGGAYNVGRGAVNWARSRGGGGSRGPTGSEEPTTPGGKDRPL